MKIIALDTETTTKNKGLWSDPNNELVCWSWATDISSGAMLSHELEFLTEGMLPHYDLVVGFNFKFDLHWLLKYGVSALRDKQIWDVQIAEFVLSNQTHRFPSLNDTCIKYDIPVKPDAVKQYWEQGVDTKDIPWETLSEYAEHDAVVTYQCYLAQMKEVTPAQKTLIYLMCQDLQILQEMEANGIPFDEELCDSRAIEVDNKIAEIRSDLQSIYPSVPINFASNDHLSAFLYGGIVKEDSKEHIGFFKTGARAGQPKYKNVILEHKLPRLYVPLKGTEMAKEGNFATDEGTLRKLKGNKKLITSILELSKLEKLNGTYYRGLPKLRQELGWAKGVLHATFNQTTVQTGRLSCTRPNAQNISGDLLDVLVSKYKE